MRFRLVARLTVLIAGAQMLVAAALWWLLTGSGVPAPAPPALPLSVTIVLAAIASVPVAIIAARVGRTGPATESLATPHEPTFPLLAQLQEAHGEALRAQNDLAHRDRELATLRTERDGQLAELEELRASLRHQVAEVQKLRADGARLEASREEQARSAMAGSSPAAEDARREGKRLQTRAVGQIAQAFRSSLTNVVGYSKLLLRGTEGELNPGQKANVATVLDAGSRLVAIVNGLSEYVRVDAGAEVAPERVDMGALVSEIAAEASGGGRVKISAAPSTDPLAASADRGHLELILRALVVDAMSLDPQATGTLSVVSAEGSIVCELALAEFHTPLDDLENLLDPFASDDLSHPLDEGRLRLAVARALAAANGGRLRLEHRGPAEVAFVLALPGAAA